MNTIDRIPLLNTFYHRSTTWVANHPRIVAISVIAMAMTGAVGLLYQHRRAKDGWTVSQQPQTEQEKNQIRNNVGSLQYSPKELLDRLCAFVRAEKKSDKPAAQNPQNPQEWLEWLVSQQNDLNILQAAQKLTPPFKENHPLSLEDERALQVQSWATTFSEWGSLLKWDSPWRDKFFGIFDPIQDSPHIVYTTLFNLAAPYALWTLWEKIQEHLPTEVQNIGSEHKGKLAVAYLVIAATFYYLKRREKGILTNVTANYASLRAVHRGLDLLQSNRFGINKLLEHISKFSPQDPHHVIWRFNYDTPNTFAEEIGNILGEMTATGRAFSPKLPSLKGLKILKLDLDAFLLEYSTKAAVRRGWDETMNHIKSCGNTLVVLTGFSSLNNLNTSRVPNEPRHPELPNQNSGELSTKEILLKKLSQSLQKGQFRCLLVMDNLQLEGLKQQQNEFFRLFSVLSAPAIPDSELKELSLRLYSAPDTSFGLPKEEIEDLFSRMKPSLEKAPLSPVELLRTLQEVYRIRGLETQLQLQDAEKNLHPLQEAQAIKEQLLQQFWQKKDLPPQASVPLAQMLLLLQHVVIPMLPPVHAITSSPTLLTAMQRHFKKFFGPCTREELERLQDLYRKLKGQIFGQDTAIKEICKALERWRKVPPLDGKPLVLFFAGPSGMGKSETATQLAYYVNEIYGIEENTSRTGEANVKRINLNAGGEKFIGWEKVNTEILCHLLENPTSVIILEEWDKMDKEDKNKMLGLLDATHTHFQHLFSYGSRNGPFVEKRNAVIIITSNVAAKPLSEDRANDLQNNIEAVTQGIKTHFAEEKDGDAFLSRIDAVIPFRKLDETDIDRLIDHYLDQYEEQHILAHNQRAQVKEMVKRNNVDIRELQRAVQKAIERISN